MPPPPYHALHIKLVYVVILLFVTIVKSEVGRNLLHLVQHAGGGGYNWKILPFVLKFLHVIFYVVQAIIAALNKRELI